MTQSAAPPPDKRQFTRPIVDHFRRRNTEEKRNISKKSKEPKCVRGEKNGG